MIIFENDGLLDIMALKTMGVSVKGDDAIGHFGTGLKYSTAVLLRSGHTVSIYIDGNLYDASTEKTTIQGEEFDLVAINGELLSYTTKLGRDWKEWMAFRELACNCLDEGGDYYESDCLPIDLKGKTVIAVSGLGMEESYADRDRIFFNHPAAHVTNTFECADDISQFIYYRGVRVAEQLTMFTYNIKSSLSLTEDRTVASYFNMKKAIAYYLLEEAPSDILYRVLVAPSGTFENALDLDWPSSKPSQVFIDLVGKLLSDKRAFNGTAKKKYMQVTGKKEEYKTSKLTAVQEKQLSKSILFLKNIEPEIEKYEILVCDVIREGVLGMADRSNFKIYLAKRVFEQGTKQVAATLIEEFYHIYHKLDDNCYEMQSFLFDKIITLGEEVAGEPI